MNNPPQRPSTRSDRHKLPHDLAGATYRTKAGIPMRRQDGAPEVRSRRRRQRRLANGKRLSPFEVAQQSKAPRG